MKIFKFGGASVKDAAAVRNVSHIISLYPQDKLIVVISAMGKTTNLLEEIVDALWNQQKETFLTTIDQCYAFHQEIVAELFEEKHFAIHTELESIFTKLKDRFDRSLSENYSFEYDQIVSLGEVISTRIVEAFLRESGHQSVWVDARKIIRTDNHYQEGNVDWEKTQQFVQDRLLGVMKLSRIAITQGFIGHTSEGFTTTLGREGSDYTAGILAFCSNATDVTIWKDVPGMLNADPRVFSDTKKLDKISFKEAIELSYYGASVIHPKTVKPLKNKGIPLYVKSFIDPHAEGTAIQASDEFDHLIPSFIIKKEQALLSITPKDFSFIVEENLSDIFTSLAELGITINLMQNSALSFSIVFDDKKSNVERVIQAFEKDFELELTKSTELVTIRHYDNATIELVTSGKAILVEQRIKDTVRMILN